MKADSSTSQGEKIKQRYPDDFEVAAEVNRNQPLMFSECLPETLKDWKLPHESLEKIAGYMLHVEGCGFSATGAGDNGVPAGYTYLGQLIAHDIVAGTSQHDKSRDVTPWLNLDSVYPEFDEGIKKKLLDNRGRFIMNQKKCEESWDYKRDNGEARIVEHRNDENIILAQLVVAWMKMHNRAITYLWSNEGNASESRDEKLCKSHYESARNFGILAFQSLVINDYLKLILKSTVFDYYFSSSKEKSEAKNNPARPIFNSFPNEKCVLPIEFTHACFRFGHSMIAETYFFMDCNPKSEYFPDKMRNAGELLRKGKSIEKCDIMDWRKIFFTPSDEPHEGLGSRNHASGIDLFLASKMGAVPVDQLVKKEISDLKAAFEMAGINPRPSMGQGLEALSREPQANGSKSTAEVQLDAAIARIESESFVRCSTIDSLIKERILKFESDSALLISECLMSLSPTMMDFKNLVVQDILSSAKSPTAGDIIAGLIENPELLRRINEIVGVDLSDRNLLNSKVCNSGSYGMHGAPETKFDNQALVYDELRGMERINIDNIPLWLYVLLEAESFTKDLNEDAQFKLSKLGPIGSLVVADVIRASIQDCEISIFKESEMKALTNGLHTSLLELLNQVESQEYSFQLINTFNFEDIK